MNVPVEARETFPLPFIADNDGMREVINKVVAWWHRNFQPATAEHAAYFAHWEGPNDACAELRFRYRWTLDDCVFDAAVREIEERGGKLWAPSATRLRGERHD